MYHRNSSSRMPKGFVALFLSSLWILPSLVVSQGCSNRCPPLNYGTPVPALCEGDAIDTFANTVKEYDVCHGEGSNKFSMSSLRGKIVVLANFYTGCNAGRRESGVFAHVAQRIWEEKNNRDKIVFVQSVKGGGTCNQWADLYQRDAQRLYPNTGVVPDEMPWSVSDQNYELRDDFFTTPFGHPSYVIIDETGVVRHKFIGPCCGYERYSDCTVGIAKGLDQQLTDYLEPLLDSWEPSSSNNNGNSNNDDDDTDDNNNTPTPPLIPDDCSTIARNSASWSDWSPCSIRCGDTDGIQFQYTTEETTCEASVRLRACEAEEDDCDDDNGCIDEFGSSYTIDTIVSDLQAPRDVDFHPTPGLHLGEYSEGREFSHGDEEAWIVNRANHSISIVVDVGGDDQTTISRRDRGYYHYMVDGTALSFNKVSDSGRNPTRDSFNYWAICNDNNNDYIGTKEPNYFMGPTLYDSRPQNRNVVNRLGQECGIEEECYFLHSDMLHEAPSCLGIVHDPEVSTAHGTVYWAFDATGNRRRGQLVRFDFQQPHGPGSMDHSVAAVRRYVEVELDRDNDDDDDDDDGGGHAGMVVAASTRKLYVANPGRNNILVIDMDSGTFARTAREEYPIFSNRLPSFEYSIWECVSNQVFASSVPSPSGMALSEDEERLFVASRTTGDIYVYEVASGALLETMETEFRSIGGMALSPRTNRLFFVDEDTNTLNRVTPTRSCRNPMSSRVNPYFADAVQQAENDLAFFSLNPSDYTCQANPIVPDEALFDQVHVDTGYADDNPNVQSNMTGMDADAALLADRTDCGYTSDLNFDALLLGGYFCHVCLPEQDLTCDAGGICENVQWEGYTCDNEFVLDSDSGSMVRTNGEVVMEDDLLLKYGVTYRFTVVGDRTLCAYDGVNDSVCAKSGPLLVTIEDTDVERVQILPDGGNAWIDGTEWISYVFNVDSSSFPNNNSGATPLVPPISIADLCFPGRAQVQLPGGRTMAMHNLTVGDKVMVQDGTYEPVHSFGHYAPNVQAEYLRLQIYGKKEKEFLELSASHMVFLPLRQTFVPARKLRVGDSLLLLLLQRDGDGGEEEEVVATIQSIHTVSRRGAFAPFTKSGTIVVNHVVASNYVAYNYNGWLLFGNNTLLSVDDQFLAHSYATLVRYCLSAFFYDTEETYTKEGISNWYALPHQLLLTMTMTTNNNNNYYYYFSTSSWWMMMLLLLQQGLLVVGIGGIVMVASMVRLVEQLLLLLLLTPSTWCGLLLLLLGCGAGGCVVRMFTTRRRRTIGKKI